MPLLARNRTVGAITLVSFARGYGKDDQALAQELGHRVALAVDNAHLYDEARAAVRVRDDVLAIVSHDLRNPLSTILTSTDRLLESLEDGGAPMRLPLERCQRAARRMTHMISDLVDAASLETGTLSLDQRDNELGRVMSDALDLLSPLADARGLQLTTELGGGAERAFCDRERIVQVLSNLVGNSIKFTPQGGHIHVSAEAWGGMVRVAVVDDGPGIAPELIPRIFDRYLHVAQRESRQGAGLGLYIAKGIVENHGGRIWVESTLGRGSAFFFTLAASGRDDGSSRVELNRCGWRVRVMVVGMAGRGKEANVSVIHSADDRERTLLRSRVLRGVELQRVTWRAVQRPPSLLSQLSLMLCDEGGCDVVWGRQLQSVAAGAVLARSPHHVSLVIQRALPETTCRVVLIDPDLLPGAASPEARRLLRFGSLVTRGPAIVDGVRALWDAIADDLAPIEQQSRLAALMAAVVELAAREGVRSPMLTPAVARTRDALHERFADEVPLEQLAVLAGMSKCHLVHLFHKEVGLPPHAYQIQLRVARARVLVAAGVPLAEVATMTGFADQSHLTRLFKRVVGMPPGQYAALLAAQSSPPPQAVLA